MAIAKIILNGVTQMDLTADTVAAANLISPNTAHGADGQAIVGTATQGITPTGSLSISANGTFDVTNYASAVVNVAGGASNVVTGTFKGTTTGAAMDINLPYTGNGYPIAFSIYPKEGYQSGSPAASLLQRYAVMLYSGVKRETTTPTYESSGSANQFALVGSYKSSASTAQTLNQSATSNSVLLSGANAASSNVHTVVKFKDKKTMSVYIASTSYGFAANIEYTYHVIYSS